MKKLFALALGVVGLMAAGFAGTGSWLGVFDEPTMPKSML